VIGLVLNGTQSLSGPSERKREPVVLTIPEVQAVLGLHSSQPPNWQIT